MQRKSTLKLFLSTFGYAVMGNVLSTVMTISIGFIIDNDAVKVIAQIFTTAIFFSLIFVAGYLDGAREASLVKLKRVDEAQKKRWTIVGLSVWGVVSLPPLFLFIDAVSGMWFDFVLLCRLMCGAVYPLSLLISPDNLDNGFPLYVPFIYIAFYALIPLIVRLGFNIGYSGKFTPENVMYEKK